MLRQSRQYACATRPDPRPSRRPPWRRHADGKGRQDHHPPKTRLRAKPACAFRHVLRHSPNGSRTQKRITPQGSVTGRYSILNPAAFIPWLTSARSSTSSGRLLGYSPSSSISSAPIHSLSRVRSSSVSTSRLSAHKACRYSVYASANARTASSPVPPMTESLSRNASTT
jgi:hypothetical protein